MILIIIAWLLVAFVPINLYLLWHSWTLNRSVEPRSPVLRALLWTETSVFLLNLYFAVVAYRFLFDLQPAMPFGGYGLGLVILFMLAAPAVIHSQMRRVIEDGS